MLLWLQKSSTVDLIQRQALVSYLVSVSFGIFVDLRQGQVGVEFVSILLRNEKQLLLDPLLLENLNSHMFCTLYSPVTPQPGERSSPAR